MPKALRLYIMKYMPTFKVEVEEREYLNSEFLL